MYMLKLENSNALNVVVIPSDLMSFYEHTTFTSFRWRYSYHSVCIISHPTAFYAVLYKYTIKDVSMPYSIIIYFFRIFHEIYWLSILHYNINNIFTSFRYVIFIIILVYYFKAVQINQDGCNFIFKTQCHCAITYL